MCQSANGVGERNKIYIQRSTLLCAPGLVKSVPAVARLSWLVVPGSFLDMLAQNKIDLCTTCGLKVGGKVARISSSLGEGCVITKHVVIVLAGTRTTRSPSLKLAQGLRALYSGGIERGQSPQHVKNMKKQLALSSASSASLRVPLSSRSAIVIYVCRRRRLLGSRATAPDLLYCGKIRFV